MECHFKEKCLQITILFQLNNFCLGSQQHQIHSRLDLLYLLTYQKTVSKAKTPYNNAQGYATNGCWWSIANTVTNNLDAEKLHHRMTKPVKMVPIVPLLNKKGKMIYCTTEKPCKMTINNGSPNH